MNNFGYMKEGELAYRASGIPPAPPWAKVVIAVGLTIVLAIVIKNIVWYIRLRTKDKRLPVTVAQARIVEKSALPGKFMFQYGMFNTGRVMIPFKGTTIAYCVIFEKSDGSKVELCVPEQQYQMLVKGDKGSLSHKGNMYVSFERTGHQAKPSRVNL